MNELAKIALWNECQQVISTGLTFVNQQGLCQGAAEQLRTALASGITTSTARDLSFRLIQFVSAAESSRQPGERLWLSTEILESTFGLYKQLEGQHSKGGFTSLLAAFGGLLKTTTPEIVREALTQVSVQDVKHWIRTSVPTTLHSKRLAIYKKTRNNLTQNYLVVFIRPPLPFVLGASRPVNVSSTIAFPDRYIQPQLDHVQQGFVAHATSHALHQLRMRDRVELPRRLRQLRDLHRRSDYYRLEQQVAGWD